MKLALDTTQTSGSLALWDSGRVIYSAWFDISITHSETLMPQVDAAFSFCGFKPADLEALLLAIGPGSFTGLRIGLAAAKGIAYALKLPLIPFDTLRLAAVNRYRCKGKILSVVDARMKQVYAALFDEQLKELRAPGVFEPETILDWELEGAYVVGNGAHLIEKLLQESEIKTNSVSYQITGAAALFTLDRLFPTNPVYDFEALAELEPLYLRDATAQIKTRA